MLIEQQIKQFLALTKWFQSPLGSFIADEFSRTLEPATDYLSGDILLQLGDCGDNNWLKPIKFNHKWIAAPYKVKKKDRMETALNQLPLPRNSIDCVLAPLTLEPFGSSFSLLDEIDRVLKPMGHIVFMSLNPWSLWGLAVKLGYIQCYDEYSIKMRSSFNLNRIFLQRGYKQCALINCCYIPPVNNLGIMKKLIFFDEVGKMIWPFPSGFYCYIVQKYEFIPPSLLPESLIKPIQVDYQSPMQPI